VRVYDPPRSREWKKRAGEIMREAVGDDPRFPAEAGAPVCVDIIAGFKRPKKAKDSFHTKNGGDLDNIAKAVLDAGNGILWDDDRQIVSLSICKLYVEVPRVEVEMLVVDAAAGEVSHD
jgi:Holliday junction resolvase RusA-like endonuclease